MIPRPSNQQHRPDTKRRILLRPLLLLLSLLPLLLLLLRRHVLFHRSRPRRRRPKSAHASWLSCRFHPRKVSNTILHDGFHGGIREIHLLDLLSMDDRVWFSNTVTVAGRGSRRHSISYHWIHGTRNSLTGKVYQDFSRDDLKVNLWSDRFRSDFP